MQGEGRSSKKSMKLSMPSIAVLFVLTAIAFTSLAVIPVAAQVTVTVNAPEYVDVEEETFFATIDVDSVTEFSYAQFDLSFDSAVVEVSAVEDGEINGETVPIYMWRRNPHDANTVGVRIMMPIGESVSGTGYLAKIEFNVEGEEGEKSELKISNEELGNTSGKEIPAIWYGAEIRIGVEAAEDEEEEEENDAGEEVTPGAPNITACKPAEAVVSNAAGEPRTFNITMNQIADISWLINGTEVQTNESVTEAAYTNTSAVIGTWNVSAIATNTTTGLSDMHTWIWSVTATSTEAREVTPTPTPASETEIEETSKPQGEKTAPKEKPTPVPVAPPTPTPKPPGFEAILAIGGMLTIAYILLRRR